MRKRAAPDPETAAVLAELEDLADEFGGSDNPVIRGLLDGVLWSHIETAQWGVDSIIQIRLQGYRRHAEALRAAAST